MTKSAAERAEARFKQLCSLKVAGEAAMPALAHEIHEIVPSVGIAFYFADEKLRLANAFNDYSTPYYSKLYFENFYGKREVAGTFPHAIRTEVGVKDTDEVAAFAGIDVGTLHRSEQWNEIQRPQGIHTLLRLFVREESTGRGLGSLTLHRSEGDPPWTPEERRRLLRLEPFLAHLLGRPHFDAEERLVESGETGLIIADTSGKPIHFSAVGQRLLFLSSYDYVGPRADFRRLNALPLPLVRICRELARLFADDHAGSPTYVHRNIWGGFTFRAYWLQGETKTGLIGITVSRQESRAVKLARRIGTMPFSRRQAQVCLLLAEGRDYERIGRDLGISKHTAIAHARWVYNKLGVHNRTELADKLLAN